MRAHKSVIVMAMFLTAAACGDQPPSEEKAQDLLYLRTSSGVALVETGASSPTFHSVTAEPAPDWETVVRSEQADSQTNLTAVDPVTNTTLWERSVPGRLRVKVVSPGADFVALAPDTGSYLSQPQQTRLIVSGRDVKGPRTIDLEGNYEPEAFSVDGKHLFVVQYLPAVSPNRYQVRRLNVATGKVQDVYSVDKELQEAMRGSARVQEMSPDGRRLYTLYSVNTPEGRHSFVHVLSLDELWAHCIDLPHGFAMQGDKRSALGVTPDNKRIYVADSAEGMVAELDAERLEVSRTTSVELSSAWKGAELTVAGGGGSIYVGSGGNLVELSTTDLEEVGRWAMAEAITGIQPGTSGRIYVGTRDEVAVIDTESGEQVETFDPPGLQSITSLGPVTKGLDPVRRKLTAVKG